MRCLEEWGGEPELVAAASIFGFRIHVHHPLASKRTCGRHTCRRPRPTSASERWGAEGITLRRAESHRRTRRVLPGGERRACPSRVWSIAPAENGEQTLLGMEGEGGRHGDGAQSKDEPSMMSPRCPKDEHKAMSLQYTQCPDARSSGTAPRAASQSACHCRIRGCWWSRWGWRWRWRWRWRCPKDEHKAMSLQ